MQVRCKSFNQGQGVGVQSGRIGSKLDAVHGVFGGLLKHPSLQFGLNNGRLFGIFLADYLAIESSSFLYHLNHHPFAGSECNHVGIASIFLVHFDSLHLFGMQTGQLDFGSL